MLDERVVFHSKSSKMLVGITEGLIRAKDDAMARHMFLHYSYSRNNDCYMDVLL